MTTHPPQDKRSSPSFKSSCRLLPITMTFHFQRAENHWRSQSYFRNTLSLFVRRRMLSLKKKMIIRIKLSKRLKRQKAAPGDSFLSLWKSDCKFHPPIPRRQRPILFPCPLPVPIPPPKCLGDFPAVNNIFLARRFAHKPAVLFWSEANSVFRGSFLF